MSARIEAKQKNGGYIALMTAILLSLSLLILVVAVSFEGFSSRFTVLESHQKESSDFLAEACVQSARVKLAEDDTYTGGEVVPVGSGTCLIKSVAVNPINSNYRDIQATASSSGAFTDLEVTVDASIPPDIPVKSWEEVPNF